MWPEQLVDRVVYLYEQRGLGVREIARVLGVRRRAVLRVLQIWSRDYPRRTDAPAPAPLGEARSDR